ncbi:acyltransferase family protein [Lactobacillus crispatus]|uniref:acyltransferase family protein n=1 Tax=Lactobacillus crispatus TaxID=47770 RepID=UPI001038A0A5|nr:acyltransferase [Lactobacillus crispatus]
MKKMRDSKFEILRIISIIFIVISHYSLWGDWDNANKFKYLVYQPLGQIGVCVFVLISGYFLSSRVLSARDGWQRANKLWLKTLIYSWIIFIITISLIGVEDISITKILMAIFPVVFGEYWFITEFIVLMLFAPLLNRMVASLNKKELKYYIGIIVFISAILPLFVKNLRPFGDMNSATILVAVYLIAGYLKKYNIRLNVSVSWCMFFGGIILELISIFVLRDHGDKMIHFTYGIIPMISAIGLFNVGISMKSFHNSFINYIASSVLAAYLITENPFIRMWLWNKALHISRLQNCSYFAFLLCGIIISILLVVVCCLIDKIYETVKIFSITKKIQEKKRQ